MSKTFLTELELSRGPDLLRPGTATGHLGSGRVAFISTRFKNAEGQDFFAESASVGHESMITRPEILMALFGEQLPDIRPELNIVVDETEHWDHIEIRRRGREASLFGRYGSVRGHDVLMLWNPCEGWFDLARRAIERLSVPLTAVLTMGRDELGTVEAILSGPGDCVKMR
jgi:hypothetical protein